MKIMTALAGIRDRLATLNHMQRTKLPKEISDYQARDIGLRGVALARHRHVWPSESMHRPML